jgi:hypothetical protein
METRERPDTTGDKEQSMSERDEQATAVVEETETPEATPAERYQALGAMPPQRSATHDQS